MKKIAEHLSQIIIALAALALILSTVVVVGPSVSDFFGDIVDKEITIGQDMMDSMEPAQAQSKGLVNVRDMYEWGTGYFTSKGVLQESSNSNYIYVRVPVVEGEEWLVWYPKPEYLTTGSGALRFEDSSKELCGYLDMSKQPQYQVNPESTKVGACITIPEGASYMCVKLKFSSSFDYTESAIIAKNTLNAKVVTLGDSIVEYNAAFPNNWVRRAANSLNLLTRNLGQGGRGYVAGYGDDTQFLDQATSIPSNADLIVIYGSFNDMYQNYYYGGSSGQFDCINIGSASDVYVEGEKNSLAATMSYTYDLIKTNNPNAKIAVIGPAPWRDFNPDATTVKATLAKEYVAVMKDVCASKDIPFLDLHTEPVLKPWIEDENNLYFNEADGCHPNDDGHEIMSKRITPFLRKVINS